MQRTLIRWAVFVGLVAFLPSLYYLAVVGQIHWTNAYALYASESASHGSFQPVAQRLPPRAGLFGSGR